MFSQDLGELTGDVLIFGGVYSNLHALKSLRAVAQAKKIAPTNIICLGDVVAYCADAAASVDMIRELGCPVLAGNCERQLADGADDCGCGYAQGSMCSTLSGAWYAHAQGQITREQREWMANLPDRLVFRHNGQRFACVHGGASDISRFIWPTTSDTDIYAELMMLSEQVGPFDTCLASHSGLPMQRHVAGWNWFNAGAIGLPAHGGGAATSYGILSNNGLKINALTYDVTAAQAAMNAAGLTQGYHETLTTGIWPSEDTLPPELRLNRN